MTADLVGRVFDSTYRIVRPLARGGMGAIYVAEHARLSNKRYAIKMLHPMFAANEHALARFRREAEIASQLGHEHIVEVLDFNVTSDQVAYMVMDFLEGEDLSARIERGPMRLPEVVRVINQVASALGAAHAANIVHRDLKPQNIFLCRRGNSEIVKVLDFGISKVRDSSSLITADQSVMGTPYYMSPEQAMGNVREVDARTDVFALGAIIWEMLIGRMAFASDTMPGALYKVVHEEPPPVHEMRADLSPSVTDVLARAMTKDRMHRTASVQEVASELARTAVSSMSAGFAPTGFARTPSAATAMPNEAHRPSRSVPRHSSSSMSMRPSSTPHGGVERASGSQHPSSSMSVRPPTPYDGMPASRSTPHPHDAISRSTPYLHDAMHRPPTPHDGMPASRSTPHPHDAISRSTPYPHDANPELTPYDAMFGRRTPSTLSASAGQLDASLAAPAPPTGRGVKRLVPFVALGCAAMIATAIAITRRVGSPSPSPTPAKPLVAPAPLPAPPPDAVETATTTDTKHEPAKTKRHDAANAKHDPDDERDESDEEEAKHESGEDEAITIEDTPRSKSKSASKPGSKSGSKRTHATHAPAPPSHLPPPQPAHSTAWQSPSSQTPAPSVETHIAPPSTPSAPAPAPAPAPPPKKKSGTIFD